MKITCTENADIQEVTMLQKLAETFKISFEEVCVCTAACITFIIL